MLKKRYLFLIVIVCFFAISAVSAEDNSTNDIVSVSNDVNSLEANSNMNSIANDTDTLKVSDDELLTAGNNWYVNSSKTSSGDGKSDAAAFKTLNEALNKASNGDTVMIASGEYKGNDNIGLTISKNLSFIKYGDVDAIFDAEGLSIIWNITASSMNINGLTFINCTSDALDFINVLSNSNINATFKNITNKAIDLATTNNVNITGNFINIENTAISSWGVINVNIRGNFINIKNTAISFYGATNLDIMGNFINNTADYLIRIVESKSGILIHDSIFLNNNVSYIIFIDDSKGAQAINNWFGNNATNYNETPDVKNVNIVNWLFLNATANPNTIAINQNSTVTFKLDLYNNISKKIYAYDTSKMNIQLDLFQTLGSLNQTTALIGEKVLYTAKQYGNASIIGKFETTSYTIYLHNIKIPTNITVEKSNITLYVNDNVSSGATLNPPEAGNLTYTSSNPNVVTVDENGIIKGLKEGTATITVSFAGDDKYAAAENKTINVTVKLRDASVSVNNDTLDLNVDDTFELNATTVPSGLDVTYSSNNESVVIVDDGKVTAKAEGTAIITVSVGGDGVYALNSTNVTVTVSKVPTEINIANATVTLKVNDNVSSGATLNPPEAGNLTYTSSNKTVVTVDENGIIKGLKEGTATITVSFAGNEQYAPAESKTITVTVTKDTITFKDLQELIDNAVNGSVVKLSTDVVFNPDVDNTTGIIVNKSIILDIDGNTIDANGNGKVFNIISDDVTVENGIIINANATNEDIIHITGNNVTIKNMTFENNSANDNGFIINVENSTDVEIKDNIFKDNEVINGTVINIKDSNNPNVDNNTFTGNEVSYDIILVDNSTGSDISDNTFDSNNITDGDIIVVNNSSDTEVKNNTLENNTIPTGGEFIKVENSTDSDISNNKYDNNIPSIDVASAVIDNDLVIEFPEDATGNISVSIGDKTFTEDIINGTVVISTDLPAGTYNATLSYSGDEKYIALTKSFNITVKSNVIIYAPDLIKYYKGSERFVVTVTDKTKKPIVGGEVKISINGITYTKTTDINGETSMAINLNSGLYNVTSEYNGTKVYSTITIKDTVIADDFSKIFRNATQYNGIFVDSQGNLIKNTKVEININGVFYTKTTNENGVATLNINLNPGVYILTATNPVTGEMHTTKVTVLPNIVENYDLTKYYKNASQYSLRLLDDKGNPVGAGVSIELNINGVFYKKISDENGYIKLNINLPPGNYIVTAEYKELKESNIITVLSVLETNDLVMRYNDGSQFKAKVLDGQGRPYAGQTVTYNINGVFYTKISGDDGIAALTINLPAGEYIITSTYNGLNAANKVTIIG